LSPKRNKILDAQDNEPKAINPLLMIPENNLESSIYMSENDANFEDIKEFVISNEKNI